MSVVRPWTFLHSLHVAIFKIEPLHVFLPKKKAIENGVNRLLQLLPIQRFILKKFLYQKFTISKICLGKSLSNRISVH